MSFNQYNREDPNSLEIISKELKRANKLKRIELELEFLKLNISERSISSNVTRQIIELCEEFAEEEVGLYND